MLENILGCLFIAWFLTWFGFDHFILGIVNGLFETSFNINAYYAAAIVIGILE